LQTLETEVGDQGVSGNLQSPEVTNVLAASSSTWYTEKESFESECNFEADK
jgi:hypothetical protein